MGDKGAAQAQGRIVLALCGFGRAGQIRFKAIRDNPRCRLKYVVEDEVEKAKGILATHSMSDVTVVSGKDLHVVLEDPEVQAVSVSTPSSTHESFCIQLLQAGKAVFCEKPVAETVEKAAHCYREAEKAGRPLYTAFQRRFDPSMSRIQAKVANGDIGKVYILKTTSRDAQAPSVEYVKMSGGMFHDTCVHDMDMTCWILNEEPVTVHVAAHTHSQAFREAQDVDTIVITMKYPSGAISINDLSRHSTYGYDQRMEVFGSNGMLQSNNPPTDNVSVMSGTATETSPAIYAFSQRYEQAYKLEIDHFLDVVSNPHKTMMVQKRDAMRVAQLAEACEASYKTGQVVSFKYQEY